MVLLSLFSAALKLESRISNLESRISNVQETAEVKQPDQEQLRSFWAYAYAEQTASSDVKRLLDATSQEKNHDIEAKVLEEAIESLKGWNKTMRHNATLRLQDNLTCALQKHAAKIGEGSTDLQDGINASSLIELCRKFVSCCTDKSAAQEVDKVIKSRGSFAKDEAQRKRQQTLDSAWDTLKSKDSPSEEECKAFVQVSRSSGGLFLSFWEEEACSLGGWGWWKS